MRIRSSADNPLEVAWLPLEFVSGRLGLTSAPGLRAPAGFGELWHRDLEVDLRRLADVGTDVLVPLLAEGEYAQLGIPDLLERAQALGFEVLPQPIDDGGVPPLGEPFFAFLASVLERLEDGRTVVVHCRAGMGRSGLVAACLLVAGGATSVEALAAVRRARPGAVETLGQERFVADFADAWVRRR